SRGPDTTPSGGGHVDAACLYGAEGVVLAYFRLEIGRGGTEEDCVRSHREVIVSCAEAASREALRAIPGRIPWSGHARLVSSHVSAPCRPCASKLFACRLG